MTRPGLVPLKYLVQINRRALPDTTNPDYEFRYIDIAAIGRGAIIAEPQRMTLAMAPSRARRLVSPGDTIVSTVRTYLRAVYPVQGETADLVVSTGLAVLTPGPSLDPRYLGWWAQSDPFIEEIVARSVGVSYPAISPSELGGIVILVPELHRQRAVADLLDDETARIDDLIAKKLRMSSLLKEGLQSALSATADELLRRWGGSRLRHVLIGMEQGWSPECEDRPAAEDEWGVVKAGCVNGGVFRPDQHKVLPSNLIPRLEYQLNPGDLLISRASGSVDLIGNVGIVGPLIRRLLLCDKVYRLHVDASRVKVPFIAHMLRTRAARDQIKLGISGASGLANNLPSSVVKDLMIPVPPLDIQEETIDRLQHALDRISDVRAVLNRQLDLLAERRQALITAAVTGQMDVTTARE